MRERKGALRWEEAELLRALKSHSPFPCLVEDAPRGRKEKKEEERTQCGDLIEKWGRYFGTYSFYFGFVLITYAYTYL